MPAQERKVIIDTANLLKVVAILLALAFLYLIRDILALVFAALFLAALMQPAVKAMSKYRIPKGVTVISLYILMFGCGVLALSLLVPPLIEQGPRLLSTFGISKSVIIDGVNALKDLYTKFSSQNFQAGIQSFTQATNAASGVFSTISDFFGGLIGLAVVLVMAFYIVAEEEEARRAFDHFVPEEYKEIASSILRHVQEKMSAWLVGQLLLCLIIGAMYLIGLSLIGLDSALVLALFGGFTEFIPYLGPILGAIPAIILALSDSPFKALLAAIVIIVIQQAEGHIIVPKVMQRAVGLNPLISIVALLVGGKLFGIVGALMAIPVATAASTVLSELYRHRQALLD